MKVMAGVKIDILFYFMYFFWKELYQSDVEEGEEWRGNHLVYEVPSGCLHHIIAPNEYKCDWFEQSLTMYVHFKHIDTQSTLGGPTGPIQPSITLCSGYRALSIMCPAIGTSIGTNWRHRGVPSESNKYPGSYIQRFSHNYISLEWYKGFFNQSKATLMWIASHLISGSKVHPRNTYDNIVQTNKYYCI